MKVIAQPVEMVSWTNFQGEATPVKFKWENKVIRIDRIVKKALERLAGNDMWVYTCQSGNRVFEMKYELRTCRWILFKI